MKPAFHPLRIFRSFSILSSTFPPPPIGKSLLSINYQKSCGESPQLFLLSLPQLIRPIVIIQ